MNSTCLVLGSTGQDGSYLVDLLLARGFRVYAMVRKSATTNMGNLQHLMQGEVPKSDRLTLVRGDLLDHARIASIVNDIRPDLIFNEADQDHVAWSVDIPSYSLMVTTQAVVNLLECIKTYSPDSILFQPVSSNMFGKVDTESQDETAALRPVSPYGIAKGATFNFCNYYRDAFSLRICTGILYNHESPRRTAAYLSRKVTSAVAEINKGIRSELKLGAIDGFVDWGYAPEFMEFATDLLLSGESDNFIIASGVLTQVSSFVQKSFQVLELNWEDYVKYDPGLERPLKTGNLKGDTKKLNTVLGRVPKTTIDELIEIMVRHDMDRIRK